VQPSSRVCELKDIVSGAPVKSRLNDRTLWTPAFAQSPLQHPLESKAGKSNRSILVALLHEERCSGTGFGNSISYRKLAETG